MLMSSLRPNRASSVAAVAGLIVCLLGAWVLLAWQLHSELLLQVLPTLAGMSRMTSIAAAVGGAAMVFASVDIRRVSAALSLVPLSIALVILSEYALNMDFGVDILPGTDFAGSHPPERFRMCPASALSWVLYSLAMLTLSSSMLSRWASAVAGVVGSGLIALGAVSMWAVFFLHSEAFVWGHLMQVAPPSSISYALLGGGLLAMAIERRPGHISGWAPAAVGLGAVAGVLGVWRAIVEHNEGDWPMISTVVMAGGLVMALLLAVAVYQTQRSRTRAEALRQSEERFRDIFEQSPIGIALVARDFRLVKSNTAYCRMVGYSDAQLASMTPLDFTHPDDIELSRKGLEEFFKIGTLAQKLEKRYVTKDGQVIWVAVTSSAIRDAQGKLLYSLAMIEDITARKRAQDELRTLTQRLSLATRSASMGVWEWNLKTNLSIWDDMMFQIFAIPKSPGVTRAEWVRLIHPEDKGKVKAFSVNIFQGKAQDEVEFRIIRPDGALRHISALGGALLGARGEVTGMVGIAVDITERKQEEEKLRALTTRFAQATEFTSTAVWEWDPLTRSHVWDEAGFTMAGIPKTAFVPWERWRQTVHPDDFARTDAVLQRIVNNKTQESVEFRVLQPGGAMRHLYAAGGPVLGNNGEVVRVVGIAIDITERRRLEADLEATREQAVASARLSALGMMAGGVAHEINNPLSVIHAMASDLMEMVMAKGSATPEVVARKSAVIRETAERIARIVKSLRQISREGSSDTFLPTPLKRIVAETLQICRAKFAANGVELLLPAPMPELTIPCREVQIAQALLNLLQNAFDAVMEQDGNRWVRLDVAARDGSVVISVTDSGPGVPLEVRPRLMEPFFTTKPVGKGTGLGLVLSKTIAEDHGGSLEYGEDQGHTRFSLALPEARKAEAA